MFTLGDWQYLLCNYANIKRYIIPKFSNFQVTASDPPAPPGGELGRPGRPGLGSPTNRPVGSPTNRPENFSGLGSPTNRPENWRVVILNYTVVLVITV